MLERLDVDHRVGARAREQLRGDQREVLDALAERRDEHAHLRETEVEVLAKASLVDRVT